jgi:hypothetical protein
MADQTYYDDSYDPTATGAPAADTNVPDPGGYGTAVDDYTTDGINATTPVDTSFATQLRRLLSGTGSLSDLAGGSSTGGNLMGILGLLGGASALNSVFGGSGNASRGYQGGIPSYTAHRPLKTQPAGGRPGAGGRQYFENMQYLAPGQAPAAPAQAPVAAAAGGVIGYARGGSLREPRYLRGDTDGMEDKIQTSIDNKEPALLSHGEFVIPADVVSHLGNGNSDAGAKKLEHLMAAVRKARTGNAKQGKQIDADKFIAKAGGIAGVERFDAGGLATTTPTPVNAAAGGTSSNSLSEWAGPYVTDMLGKGQALSNMPYQSYQGPLTAGASGLQQQAFQGIGNLQTPAAGAEATEMAGQAANKMGNLNYNPTTFQTGTGTADALQPYMNPYLQMSLQPQLDEARRQSQISRLADNTRLTQAGAFGGSRQAIMDSETNRNLGTNLAAITGKGYDTAFTNAQNQFNADQNRSLTAQQGTEGSRQFGANFGLQGLQGQLTGAKTMGDLAANEQNLGLQGLQAQLAAGTAQRDIEGQGLAADKAAFEAERDAPYKQVQFQQSLLQGLPIATNTTLPTQATGLNEAAGVLGLYKQLKTMFPNL